MEFAGESIGSMHNEPISVTVIKRHQRSGKSGAILDA
jgi:hypothetical protein